MVRACLHPTWVSKPMTAENQFPDHVCADCGATWGGLAMTERERVWNEFGQWVRSELRSEAIAAHPYTVDSYLHGPENPPCLVCGKGRQAHG